MTRYRRMTGPAAALALASACASSPVGVEPWTLEEIEALRSLWIGSLEAPPPDPTNRWADDERAAALGHRLFFDERLSGDGGVSCATCHRPETEFQDGTPLAVGVGTTDRRTMPIAGTATAPGSSGTAGRTARGRRRSARWRAPSSTEARARSTCT